MALSINLNSIVNVDANHTVSISAGAGVTATTTTTDFLSSTNYVLTPNSGVQATVATITFTASSGYYYFKEPRHNIRTSSNTAYDITETITKDSSNRITSKVFVIKYTNTVNSFGDVIIFDHSTKALPATTNVHNNALVEIKSFELDTSDIVSTGATRSFIVKGDATAKFNLKITKDNPSGSDTTYDFTTNTFTASATELTSQEIDDTGEFIGFVTFPNISVDDTYTVELSPSLVKGTTLNSSIQDTTNENLHTLTINQYKAITITVALSSTSYSGSYSDLTSTVTFVGERNSKVRTEKSISFDLSLSANSFTFARGYTTSVAGMHPLDIRSSIVKVKNGNQAAGTTVAFDDVSKLAVGMSMTGTGVTGSPRVVSIDFVANTIVVSVTQNAQGDGGMADDANITFTYGGSEISKLISGCEFELLGIDEVTSGVLLNAATLTPVETLVNGAVSSSATVNVDSAAGIKAASTTFVSGRGINAAALAPHVDSVNTGTNTVTLSANQTLDDNTPLTFTGSSRNATLAFDLAITNFGTQNRTLTINLATILTVS